MCQAMTALIDKQLIYKHYCCEVFYSLYTRACRHKPIQAHTARVREWVGLQSSYALAVPVTCTALPLSPFIGTKIGPPHSIVARPNFLDHHN